MPNKDIQFWMKQAEKQAEEVTRLTKEPNSPILAVGTHLAFSCMFSLLVLAKKAALEDETKWSL